MIVKENPKRLKPQRCPLCNEEQDIIVNGYCKNGDQLVVDRDKGYSFCRCKNIFFTDWENMEEAYNKEYFDRYDSEISRKTILTYAKSYFPILKEHTPEGEFLEIGAINSTLLDEAKKKGYKTTGLDIFEHKLGGHKLIKGNFEDIKIDKKFNIIWASHIFEHFKRPLEMIDKCHSLLSNGLLFIAMPDPFTIDWKDPYLWGHWHYKEHHILWDLDTFIGELESRGFDVILGKRNFDYNYICIGDFHILAKKR